MFSLESAAKQVEVMASMSYLSRTAQWVLQVTTVLFAVLAFSRHATAAFYINCAGCHTVPQDGMAIVNFQTTTNLGSGVAKVFRVSPGQTAVIELNVTNAHGGSYALNINHLWADGVNNTNDHLVCTPDPAWTSYFPDTSTNFFMAGPATSCPNVWTFNLVVKTNTPADFYILKSQMAGYDAASQMWSQQETLYVQVIATTPTRPTLSTPRRSGNAFSVQVGTASGFTYYLEYKSDLSTTTWITVAQTAGDGTNKALTDATANDWQRFYQVRVQ